MMMNIDEEIEGFSSSDSDVAKDDIWKGDESSQDNKNLQIDLDVSEASDEEENIVWSAHSPDNVKEEQSFSDFEATQNEFEKQNSEPTTDEPVSTFTDYEFGSDSADIEKEMCQEQSYVEFEDCSFISTHHRTKVSRGGLAERLKRILAREKSDGAFWYHDKETKKNHDTSLILEVVSLEVHYSVAMMKCKISEMVDIFVILPNKIIKSICPNSKLQVFPPWRRFFCKNLSIALVLCTPHLLVWSGSIPKARTTAEREMILFQERNLNFKKSNFDVANVAPHFEKTVSDKQTDLSYDEKTASKRFSLTGRIQRTYIQQHHDNLYSHEQLKMSKQEERYVVVLIQANDFILTEILVPESLVLNCTAWKSVVCDGEGKIGHFKNIYFVERKSLRRHSAHFSMMKTFFPPSADDASVTKKNISRNVACFLNTNVFIAIENESVSEFQENDVQTYGMSKISIVSGSTLVFYIFYTYLELPYIVPSSTFEFNFPDADSRLTIDVRLFTVTDLRENNVHECCVFHCSLLHGDRMEMVTVTKLPSCFVPYVIIDAISRKRNDPGPTDDVIMRMKDIRAHDGQVFADKYTRLYMVKSSSHASVVNQSEFHIRFCELAFNEVVLPVIPLVNWNTKKNEMVAVQGVIGDMEKNEEMPLSICKLCRNSKKYYLKKKVLFCHTCQKEVADLQLRVHIDTQLVRSPTVLCTLLPKTITSHLTKISTTTVFPFDLKRLQGQKFGPKICHVKHIFKTRDEMMTMYLTELQPLCKYEVAR